MYKRTCIKDKINNEVYAECYEFIQKVRECRHKTILARHLNKFNQLCQQTKGGHSNHLGAHSNNYHACTGAQTTSNCYINHAVGQMGQEFIGSPPYQIPVSLLAYGPNFAVALNTPLWELHSHC